MEGGRGWMAADLLLLGLPNVLPTPRTPRGFYQSNFLKNSGTSARATAQGRCTGGRPEGFQQFPLKMQGRPPVQRP